MKKYFFSLGLFISLHVNAQELFCNIQVNASQIQTSDRKVFQTLQTAIYEFVNNTKWTSASIKNEERIECTFLINIKEKVSNDEFKASIQIQINYTDEKEINVRAIEHISGDWVIRDATSMYTKKDATTIYFPIKIKPNEQKSITYTYRKEWK